MFSLGHLNQIGVRIIHHNSRRTVARAEVSEECLGEENPVPVVFSEVELERPHAALSNTWIKLF